MYCVLKGRQQDGGTQESALQRSADSQGFTLLELIVVIFLMGLLLVVSVPALRDSLLNDPLRSAGRKLIGYIGGVRELVVRQQKPYVIYVDLDGNRLWHLPEDTEAAELDDPPEKVELELPDGVELRDLWVRSSGNIARGVHELWLSRQGYLEKCVIRLEDGDGETLSFVLQTFLPEIEVREGYYEPQ